MYEGETLFPAPVPLYGGSKPKISRTLSGSFNGLRIRAQSLQDPWLGGLIIAPCEYSSSSERVHNIAFGLWSLERKFAVGVFGI